jgi:hypothetical protein
MMTHDGCCDCWSDPLSCRDPLRINSLWALGKVSYVTPQPYLIHVTIQKCKGELITR